jgi:hypothetical protein
LVDRARAIGVTVLGENGCSELGAPEQDEALGNDIMLMVNEK